MMTTALDVTKYGFHFNNGTFKTHVGPVACSVLCGGMSYAAMDYVYTGILAPETKVAPAEGNPLETYLYRRQTTAHFYTWHKFSAAWSTNIPVIGLGLDLAGVGQSDINELARHIGRKVPVVICLFDGVGEGHHVVAIGCDASSNKIQLYDCNHPDKTSLLALKDGRWHHSVSNRKWKGWFIDMGYFSDGTRQPPLAWRMCSGCCCLHTTRFGGTIGPCPAGGSHKTDGMEYFLHWDLSQGQRRWFACRKCQAIASMADPLIGKACSAGGEHELRKDELAVKRDSGPGSAMWKQCYKCACLYWSGAGNGKCAKGGAHEPKYSANYFLDYRTV
jgi:hypothetical protein